MTGPGSSAAGSRGSHRLPRTPSLHGGAAAVPPPPLLPGGATNASGPSTSRSVEMEKIIKLQSLCEILGINLKQKILEEVDASVGDVNEWISNFQTLNDSTMNRLDRAIEGLNQVKISRFQMVKEMVSSIIAYWNVLSTSSKERQIIINLLYYSDLDSVDQLKEANSLSLRFIETVENELNRLAQQGNDLVTKKKEKLMEIYRMTHLECNLADIAATDTCAVIEELKAKILDAKRKSASRRPIVLRFEQIGNILEEIIWSIAYQKQGRSGEDDRATIARGLAPQFPKMLQAVNDMASAWFAEKGNRFTYDGVDIGQLAQVYGNRYQAEMDDFPFALNIPRRARTARVPIEQMPAPAQEPMHPPAHPQASDAPMHSPDEEAEASDQSMGSPNGAQSSDDALDPTYHHQQSDESMGSPNNPQASSSGTASYSDSSDPDFSP